MSRRFRKVYKCSKYDGECVWDLLKFLRDVDLVHPPYKDADIEMIGDGGSVVGLGDGLVGCGWVWGCAGVGGVVRKMVVVGQRVRLGFP
ncbi:hypothetical protein ACE6H2_024985 [Prunus campanulata]